MGSDEVRRRLLTGDIVFAKTPTGPSGTGGWAEVALVICPEDVGAVHTQKPVVFTVDGSLGELRPTVRAYAGNELAIVPSQASGNPALLAQVRDAVMSVQVIAADPAGAAVLNKLQRGEPFPSPVVDT